MIHNQVKAKKSNNTYYNDVLLKSIIHKDDLNKDSLNNAITKIISFMRKSIYTSDMYHALRYEIYRVTSRSNAFEFRRQPASNLYPFNITSFNPNDINLKSTSPTIIIDRLRKALSTTRANKLHVFATLRTDNPTDDRTTLSNMKTIAYANRLRYLL